ncbi:hypothetical protein A8F94_24520 [Bacillus sp. FJAT-27225]|uniref:hypothetical protein n=1 Tax=Bacillus sp. FJAT-27225 TaxID=1743144 RepID=UPI00080C28E5|nr:hypothetical protein [Bacillus sp. FJAT-27225]OCA88427.1 hypothetical protein A8F94_24520 [Bacillus sp. FJAT-27225]
MSILDFLFKKELVYTAKNHIDYFKVAQLFKNGGLKYKVKKQSTHSSPCQPFSADEFRQPVIYDFYVHKNERHLAQKLLSTLNESKSLELSNKRDRLAKQKEFLKMAIDWEEVNLLIQEWSSKKPLEMSPEDAAKISFLIDEIYSFPDNQKTVVESGDLFRKYLYEKYAKLSPDSIERLVYRFCFLNR